MLEHYHGVCRPPLSYISFDSARFIRNPSTLFSAVFFSHYLFAFFIYIEYHWREAKNTRSFLDNFATEHQFDPLIAENWYRVSTLALKKAMVFKHKKTQRDVF
jgi:hypothetical protein